MSQTVSGSDVSKAAGPDGTSAAPEIRAEASTAGNPYEDKWPVGKKAAYFTCFVAFLLGMFDLIDRMVMASLFPYLKAEYALSDAQLGSLMSIVNVSISLLVVPSGYFIDRWSRKKMMCIMGVVWSLATGACAFAGTFSHLLMARFVVGAGEAGYNPAAQSLLAASFPRRLRTTAVGLAQFGMALGGPVGLVLGAYVATHYGWRHAFGLVAIPGLFVSLLALTLKDFKNVKDVAASDAEARKPEKVPYAVVLRDMMRTPTLLCVFICAALSLFFTGTMQSWLPTYYNRVAHLPMTTSSFLAAMTFVCSSLAILLGGPLMDWARTKRSNAAPIWMCFCMLLAGVARVWIFGFATPGSVPQIAVMIGIGLVTGTMGTVSAGMVVDISHPGHRASAVSLMVFVQNILGYAVGPFLTGWLSDMFDLNTAILIVTSVWFIGAALYVVAIFTYDRDRAKVANITTEF